MSLKVLSLFSGIGAFEKALKRENIDYELVNYCEIDKWASKAYSLIHNVSEDMNLGDITKIDTSKLPKDIDLITYGFPCQDISLAGKQKGFVDENGDITRSGLFFQALRIIEDTQPKVAIAENVKALVSKKFTEEFKVVLNSLEAAGYNNYYQVLNAKNYGIPQNRERVFIISIRKDIDKGFEFPEPFDLELRLRDLLESTVDEKYYLSDKQIESVAKWKAFEKPLEKMEKTDKSNISPTLTTRSCAYAAGMILVKEKTGPDVDTVVRAGQFQPKDRDYNKKGIQREEQFEMRKDELSNAILTGDRKNCVAEIVRVENYSPSGHNAASVVDSGGIAPTVMENHGTITAVVEDKRNMKEKLCDTLIESGLCKEYDVINHSYTNGLNGKNPNSRQTLDDYFESKDGVSPCLTTRPDTMGIVVEDKRPKDVIIYDDYNSNVRKDQNTIGTITTNIGNNALRNGYKIIEVESKNLWTDTQAKMITPEGDVKRYIHSDVVDKFEEGQAANISYPNGYGKGNRVYDVCPAINTTDTQSNFITKVSQSPLRIRKLTPKECFRLMGFDDADHDVLVENKISNAQIYKMAGNSIVVDVLQHLFRKLEVL